MKPVKPRSAAPSASGRTFDPLLDPLPQPDVVESDSDSVWGLWQETVMPQDTQAASFKDSVYKDTEPMGLPEIPSFEKPSGSSF